MLLPPYDVFREQLSSLFYGHALWMPDPDPLQPVSIGDVGYVREGYFVRMFNVLLEWDNVSNRTFCEPEQYTPLDMGPFHNVKTAIFEKGRYYSRHVNLEATTDVANATPDDLNFTRYSCHKRHGALLAVPSTGINQDVIRTKAYEDYIRDNVDNWFAFARRNSLGVDRMEDLILVTGCTLVTSWGVAAFTDNLSDAELSLRIETPQGGRTIFDWRVDHPSVVHQDSYKEPINVHQNQCVFIRGFRAKRVFIWTKLLRAAAEPPPDDPEPPSLPEGGIQVTQVADIPNHRDPLTGVLDYILEKHPERTLAIVHDDDLQFVEEVDLLTADTVKDFLRQHEIGTLIENGAAVLHKDEAPEAPDEVKLIFFAEAESQGEQAPLTLHPVLSRYLKLDISKPIGYDSDLLNEEITSPAVYPPLMSLKLENYQGYPHRISACSGSSGTGITVQDVLKAIHEDLGKPLRRREWTELSAKDRAVVDAAYKERCSTKEELSQGPRGIDYLRGRDRLQILPKLSPDREPMILTSP